MLSIAKNVALPILYVASFGVPVIWLYARFPSEAPGLVPLWIPLGPTRIFGQPVTCCSWGCPGAVPVRG